MADTPFQKFMSLIKYDHSLCDLEVKLDEMESDLEELSLVEDNIKKLFVQKGQDLKDLHRDLDQKERALTDLDERQKDVQKKSQSASTTREINAFLKEADLVRVQQNENESNVMKAYNVVDTAKREFESYEKEYEEKLQQARDVYQQRIEAIVAVEKEIEDKQEERNSKKEGIPEEWMEGYIRMRGSVKNPVVPVKGNICTGCYWEIIDQDMLFLARKKLLQCKGCFRFLYSEAQKGED